MIKVLQCGIGLEAIVKRCRSIRDGVPIKKWLSALRNNVRRHHLFLSPTSRSAASRSATGIVMVSLGSDDAIRPTRRSRDRRGSQHRPRRAADRQPDDFDGPQHDCAGGARGVRDGADLVRRTMVYGALDTLENLMKGGRIATALSIMPIIEVFSGVVKQASKQCKLVQLVETAKKFVGNVKPEMAFIRSMALASTTTIGSWQRLVMTIIWYRSVS
jgi:hypothetical protein